MSTRFKGRLAGVDYDQAALFEQAAKVLGFGFNRRSWKPGAPVTVRLREVGEVSGQVWSQGPTNGYVWVALETGQFVLVGKRSREVWADQNHREHLGRVA